MAAEGHRLVFESFGLVTELSTDDRALFDSVSAALPPSWRASKDVPSARVAVTRAGVITLDGEEVERASAGAATTLRLGMVLRHHVAEHAPDHTFIHAGVVAFGDPAGAIVIPGRSYSGKTSLVAELVRAGATYYSDEYAVVDRDGLIHPFAKPLSVRSQSSQELVPVPEAQTATEPLRSRLIVVTGYRPGARWEPSIGTAGEGAQALLDNTVSARTRPGDALAAVSALARGSRVLAGARGEASEVAASVLAGLSEIRDPSREST
jgi:hypothetical protein